MEMNRNIIIGRLVKDPEIQKTATNLSVVSFTLAVNRPYAKDQADYIDCVAWKHNADFLCTHAKAKKGDIVSVEGRLQTRSYESDNGNRKITEVVVERLQVINGTRAGNVVSGASDETAVEETSKTSTATDEDVPF